MWLTLNCSVFLYKLSGCGCDSSCNHQCDFSKGYASTYNVEILNSFNPELQLKDT